MSLRNHDLICFKCKRDIEGIAWEDCSVENDEECDGNCDVVYLCTWCKEEEEFKDYVDYQLLINFSAR